MGIVSEFALPGALFLLTLAFGVWLSSSGKPYSGVLFNIHKLLALGTVIVTGIEVYRRLQNTGIPIPFAVPLIVAALCVVGLFVTGALMSTAKSNCGLMLTIHRVAVFLLLIVMAGNAFLYTAVQP